MGRGRKSKKSFVRNLSEPTKKARISKSTSRRHVPCDCNLCKGCLVDPRTKESHMKSKELPIRRVFSNVVVEEDVNQINVPVDSMDIDISSIDNVNSDSSDSSSEQELNFLVTKSKKPQLSNRGVRSRTNFPSTTIEQYYSDEEQDVNDDINLSDEDNADFAQHVDFSAPESGCEDKNFDVNEEGINHEFSWIIYWIFKFQERNRLSDTAINALIKFMRYVLILIDADSYSKFPTSLYMARKLFGIDDQMIEYATCKKCCKLYTINELSTDKPYHCTFQD